jgi:hypothetical protein
MTKYPNKPKASVMGPGLAGLIGVTSQVSGAAAKAGIETSLGASYDAFLRAIGFNGVDDFSNLCYVCDVGDGRVHAGPHSLQYHEAVLKRIQEAIEKAQDRHVPGQTASLGALMQAEVQGALTDLCDRMNTIGTPERSSVTSLK